MVWRRLRYASTGVVTGGVALVALCAILVSHQPGHAAGMVTREYPSGDCPTTLQACITASSAGDVVQIRPGIYTESVTVRRAIILVGLGSAPDEVELRAAPNQRVMTLTTNVNGPAVLRNLSLTGGRTTGDGGGIFFDETDRGAGASLLLDTVVIHDNHAASGGGVASAGAEIRALDTVLTSNIAANVGGGLMVDGDVYLTATTVFSNQAQNWGGGAYAAALLDIVDSTFESNVVLGSNGDGGGASAGQFARVTRSRFVRNTAGIGGGLSLFADSPSISTSRLRVSASLFSDNAVGAGGTGAAIYARAKAPSNLIDLMHLTVDDPDGNARSAIFIEEGTARITNTIVARHNIGLLAVNGSATAAERNTLFWDNAQNTGGAVTAAGGSLTANPNWINTVDYRIPAGSPALDAGLAEGSDPDFEGQTRPIGPSPDIGWDEAALNDLVVALEGLPAVTDVGVIQTVRLVVTNTGPYPVNGISIRHAWDVAVQFDTATSDAPISCDPLPALALERVCILNGSLGPSVGWVVTQTVRPQSNGALQASVEAIAASPDPNPANNITTQAVQVGPNIGLLTAQAAPTLTVMGAPVLFTATYVGPSATVTWDPGDGSPSVAGLVYEHRYVASGVYTATVTSVAAQGAQSKTVRVVVSPPTIRKIMLPQVRR
jgi:PKD domain